ncbi:hypothetical protein Csa_006034 [Cucumis sativus]|uniref:Uncharacterized protein n=1 Tax=Cucumis sativus TaxID=3659 RepID=A0A0A0LLD5_CUCSA|nr:hypothetical protein Csa_006034 [Cucumis sativus]
MEVHVGERVWKVRGRKGIGVIGRCWKGITGKPHDPHLTLVKSKDGKLGQDLDLKIGSNGCPNLTCPDLLTCVLCWTPRGQIVK